MNIQDFHYSNIIYNLKYKLTKITGITYPLNASINPNKSIVSSSKQIKN